MTALTAWTTGDSANDSFQAQQRHSRGHVCGRCDIRETSVNGVNNTDAIHFSQAWRRWSPRPLPRVGGRLTTNDLAQMARPPRKDPDRAGK